MPVVLLLVLVVAWAAFLLPPLLRHRAAGRPARDPIGEFSNRLGQLGEMSGGRPVAAANVFAARRTVSAVHRRRQVFTALGAAALFTFVVAAVSGMSTVWALHVLADACLVAYGALVSWFRQNAMERAEKVRYIHARGGRGDFVLRHPSAASERLRAVSS